MDTTNRLTRMDATFRKTMTSVTDLLFPVQKERDSQKQHIIKKPEQQPDGATAADDQSLRDEIDSDDHEYVTSLPLQMSLYFNSFFFPFWIIGSIICLELKWSRLDNLYRIVLVAIYMVYFIIEIIRLYIGYLGNLMERVPELAGSWLITLLISTPLILLLNLNNSSVVAPLERALHLIMGLFVLFEVVIGYFAIRAMVKYQVTKFHLQQFSDMENIDDNMSYTEGRYNC